LFSESYLVNRMKTTVTSIEIYLEKLAKTITSAPTATFLKMLLAYPRYFLQLAKAHQGYAENKALYPNSTLLILGLPKSGTTWLEELLLQFPGFSKIHFPETVFYESRMRESHSFTLSEKQFDRLVHTLSVVKVHSNGSDHNINVLTKKQIRYVVMYRDLRDVAVSYYYFVSQRPWHPEYQKYKNLTVQEGLDIFSCTLLPIYAEWVRSWHDNHNRDLGMEVRYEDLLADTIQEYSKVIKHFELPYTSRQVKEIIERYQDMSKMGNQLASTHFRKGVAGGWEKHFTPSLKEKYKKEIGEFLVEFGYETNFDW
jgi:hypothetical protein